MASTDFGLMKMATGKSPATCSLLMALPLTSRIQCLPCQRQTHVYIKDTVLALSETDTFVHQRYSACPVRDRHKCTSKIQCLPCQRQTQVYIQDTVLALSETDTSVHQRYSACPVRDIHKCTSRIQCLPCQRQTQVYSLYNQSNMLFHTLLLLGTLNVIYSWYQEIPYDI